MTQREKSGKAQAVGLAGEFVHRVRSRIPAAGQFFNQQAGLFQCSVVGKVGGAAAAILCDRLRLQQFAQAILNPCMAQVYFLAENTKNLPTGLSPGLTL